MAERGRQAHYKLTSTIMLSMVDRGVAQSNKDDKIEAKRDGEVTISGSMTRQVRPQRLPFIILTLYILSLDRTGPLVARPELTYHEHWTYD